ncbi:MAG: ester cyclase [Frankiaceae bacterium]
MSLTQSPEVHAPKDSARAIMTALAHRDLAALERLYAPDVVDEVVADDVLHGWPAVRIYLADFFQAFPDAMVTVRRTVADGERVAVEWEWSGSHEGPRRREPAIRPTRRLVTLRALEVMEFQAGLLVRNIGYSDFGSMARQMHLIPATGSRTEAVAVGAANLGALLREGASRVRASAGEAVAAGRARVRARSEAAQTAGAASPAAQGDAQDGSGHAAHPAPIAEATAAASPSVTPGATAPPASSAARVATQLFAALDAHDLDAAAALWHPDVVEESATGLHRGRNAVRAEFTAFIAAMPNFSIRPLDFLAEGDLTVVRWWASGTHTGAKLQGLRATGARLGFAGADLIEVKNNVIVSNTVYYDTATVARQLGALPPPGSSQERLLLASANAVTRVRDQAKAVSSWMTERLR